MCCICTGEKAHKDEELVKLLWLPKLADMKVRMYQSNTGGAAVIRNKNKSPSDQYSSFLSTRFLEELLDLLMKSVFLRPDSPISRLPLLFMMPWCFGRNTQALALHQCGKASHGPDMAPAALC